MGFFFLCYIDWFMKPIMDLLFRLWITLENRRQNMELLKKSTYDVFKRLDHVWRNQEEFRWSLNQFECGLSVKIPWFYARQLASSYAWKKRGSTIRVDIIVSIVHIESFATSHHREILVEIHESTLSFHALEGFPRGFFFCPESKLALYWHEC